MKRQIAIFVMGILFLVSNAQAKQPELSASFLFEICSSEDALNQIKHRQICTWFIMGILTGHYETVRINQIKSEFCLKEGMTLINAPNLIMEYGKTNPKELKKPAADFIFKALKKSWPCEKK